jgi:hypothetical protein
MKFKALRVYVVSLLVLILNISKVSGQLSTNELPPGVSQNINLSSLPARIIFYNENAMDHAQDDFGNLAGISLQAGLSFDKNSRSALQPDGSYLWHLKVHVPGAPFLGLVLSQFHLQENEKVFIYDETGVHHLGAFTRDNNKEHGYLSTDIIPSSTLIIEAHTTEATPPAFIIDEIVYVWSDKSEYSPESLLNAGACNVNINCPEGQNWQKQKRGIVRIFLREGRNWYNCSGTLINNTAEDRTPYILTADHCGPNSTAADLNVWRFFFNNEYTSCTNTGTLPNNMMLEGALLMARAPLSGGTDFKLLKLNNAVPDSWKPYYNGWSRLSRNPESGVAIHHPAGDAKKISTYTTTLSNATFTGGMSLGYWQVVWSQTISGHGVTEGGSSGAPIFESNGLVTGTLTGGSASCTEPTKPDLFGKFYLHWQANGTTSDRRLAPWLDPLGLNPQELYGYDPINPANFVVVNAAPKEGGTVSGGGYFVQNEKITVTAQPSGNFHFISWKDEEGTVVSTNPDYVFNMPDVEVNLTAFFSLDPSADTNNINKPTIHIYPNPLSGKQLKIEFSKISGSADISIYNLKGQNMGSFTLNNIEEDQQMQIPTGILQAGIYIVIIKVSGMVTQHKLIVTH